ncbi:MAG TPA: hypothetical protein VNZ49_09010 [Bacteroidia bacterium]|jgi:hypothetical protein|nr:hypothetical protein [Bacteroidia bacterium]
MDVLNDPTFYGKDVKKKNLIGLKYYSKMERAEVFSRQNSFLKERGVLITDIVKAIKPASFENIYRNFPDTTIERSFPEWNTDNIIRVIQTVNPKNIIINFNTENKSTPSICNEITKITKRFPRKIVSSLKSTSGAAGHTYSELIENWKLYFV